MRRDWKRYNKELVKRGEILIDSSILGFVEGEKQEKRMGIPPLYPDSLIRPLSSLSNLP